ncbi:hypothetical protein HGRIS_007163 [Hohenbuehelia grisea]|uniref:Uncharacterized protein n=1 Tax=Hohenbuehelia grisea TaxID=104357 RepID=A0ABR3JB84_9AGAR
MHGTSRWVPASVEARFLWNLVPSEESRPRLDLRIILPLLRLAAAFMQDECDCRHKPLIHATVSFKFWPMVSPSIALHRRVCIWKAADLFNSIIEILLPASGVSMKCEPETWRPSFATEASRVTLTSRGAYCHSILPSKFKRAQATRTSVVQFFKNPFGALESSEPRQLRG